MGWCWTTEPEEVRSYHENVDAIFEMFSELLANDVKDAL